MEPLDDKDLNELLRQWQAPKAPLSLEQKFFPWTPSLLLVSQDWELPWYRTIGKAILERIHPPERPPLIVTSKPVDPNELKGLAGLYAGNERTAGLTSILIHCGVVAFLFFLSTLKPVQVLLKEQLTIIAPDLSAFKPKENKGGGGGGAKQPLDASKGKLPKIAPKQFTPPRVDQVEAKLPMTPTIVADTALPDLVANDLGNPLSKFGIPSNGIGSGGGIGSGSGGGVGSGKGPGVGPGSGGGFGGGVYKAGGGVSNPSLLVKVEPQYSEEARKAKWQGTVILSLIVDENGKAQQIKVTHTLGLGLDEEAIKAVAQWKFKPGMKDGKPVPVYASVEVKFTLL